MSPRYSNVTSSIRGYDYTICVTQSQIHLFNQHIEPQECPKVPIGESRRKRVPTPMHRFIGGTQKLVTKTYIKRHMIPHCHHDYSIARHISSVLKSIKVFNPITTKSQREKPNSSQQDREGKTRYDPNILTKPVIHQDHAINKNTRERERERLNT